MVYISLIFIIFFSIGLGVIIGLKMSELKTGKSGVLSRLSSFADPILRRKLETGKVILGHANFTNVGKVFGVVAENLFHIFGTAGLFISKHYARFMCWIRGRKYIRGGGVVSFFLRNVAESKGEKRDQNHES